MSVTPTQFDVLGSLLSAAALRQQVIGQNIANVNTPGYRRLDVTFEEELARRLDGLEPGRLDGVLPRVQQVPGLPSRADGNNVDIDMEMGQLSKNAILYQTYAQVLASKLAIMRSAITGE